MHLEENKSHEKVVSSQRDRREEKKKSRERRKHRNMSSLGATGHHSAACSMVLTNRNLE